MAGGDLVAGGDSRRAMAAGDCGEQGQRRWWAVASGDGGGDRRWAMASGDGGDGGISSQATTTVQLKSKWLQKSGTSEKRQDK